MRKSLSRNLNYQDVFNNLIAGIKNFQQSEKDKLTQQTKIEFNSQKVIFGSSGGMDSAIINFFVSLTYEANNILAISMPSEHNSQNTQDLARNLSKSLKNNFETHPIEINETGFVGENLQARTRALILQTKRDRLIAELPNTIVSIFNTSNKSEILTGNFTINGDTIGDLGILRELYKTEIYNLFNWISSNRNEEAIEIIKKIALIAPSAELAPNQQDANILLNGDIFYKITDMILIGKEKNLSHEVITKELIEDNDFQRWSKTQNKDQNVIINNAILKIEERLLLSKNKINSMIPQSIKINSMIPQSIKMNSMTSQPIKTL